MEVTDQCEVHAGYDRIQQELQSAFDLKTNSGALAWYVYLVGIEEEGDEVGIDKFLQAIHV